MESITDTLIVKLLRIFSYLYSKIKHYSIPLKTKSKMLVNNAKKSMRTVFQLFWSCACLYPQV